MNEFLATLGGISLFICFAYFVGARENNRKKIQQKKEFLQLLKFKIFLSDVQKRIKE